MRAGSLNRTITLLAVSYSEPGVHGNVEEIYTPTATLRAQLVASSTEEFFANYGEFSTSVVVFRIRYRAGVTNDSRIQFEGRTFDLKEVKEIGHRDGLELRCEEVRL